MSEVQRKSCPEWRVMLHGFSDSEFDAAHASQCQDHLATCPDCRAAMEEVRAERTIMNQDGVKWRAPEALRAQVLSTPAAEQGQQSQKTAWRRALGLKQWALWLRLQRLRHASSSSRSRRPDHRSSG